MKKIEAIIRTSRFEQVKTALSESGTNFFTFFEVKGFGKQASDHVLYRGAEYDLGYIGRVKIEIIVSDQDAYQITQTIKSAAQTGEIGDGKIIITAIDEIISIRTSKVNESAL